jgi:putative copper export protein
VTADAFESAGGLAVVATRAVTFTGITLVVGALVFRRVVVARLSDAALRESQPALGSPVWLGLLGALVALLVAPVRIALQSAALADGSLAMVAAVAASAWGLAIVAQGLTSGGVIAGLLMAQAGRARGWTLATASAVGLTLTPALTGHAVAAEQYWLLSMLSDWAHVIAAGGWIGTLVVLTIEVRRDAAARAPGERAAALIESFHRVAMVCAGIVVTTGVVSLLLRVPHPLRDLWPSVWADVLLWKLAPVAMVLLFGALHGWKGPQRARAKGARQLAGTLLWECIFAAIVLLVTAQLVGTEPPGPG